jgi:glucokinase
VAPAAPGLAAFGDLYRPTMRPRRVIGIDAGGTKLLGGVVDEELVVHHRVRRAWRGSDRQETLEIFVQAVEEVRAAAPDVDAVGFGVPALVERSSGASVWSNHLPIDDVPFRDLMSERLGLPVVVDNDANVAVLAEHRHGAARGADHAVLVALGTGVGGGLVLDGRVYRGARGFAGELGHMVADHDGEDCPGACPGRGCLESLASGRAIGRMAREAAAAEPRSTLGRRAMGAHAITGGLVTELAHDGDRQARAVLAEVGRRLGAGLCSVVNVFDPEVVVVGGGAVAAGDLLLRPARRVVAERALPAPARAVRIVPAHFGDESGMLGAALMALEAGPA